MHFNILVFGEDVDAQLEKYSENLEVEEYVVRKLTISDWMDIIGYYNITEPMSKNEIIKLYGSVWNNAQWKKVNGRWVEVSTSNPNGMYDYYDYNVAPNKLIVLKNGKHDNTALLKEIDWNKTEDFVAIVVDGVWHALRNNWVIYKIQTDVLLYDLEGWRRFIKRINKILPPNTLVVGCNCHC